MAAEINATFIIVMAFCFNVTQFSCLFEAVFFIYVAIVFLISQALFVRLNINNMPLYCSAQSNSNTNYSFLQTVKLNSQSSHTICLAYNICSFKK